MTRRPVTRIVLGYSGSLETSVSIPWLAGEHGAEVVAVTLDLGQGHELEDVRDRALASGAARAHVIDARDEFARDFVLPSLRAGAAVGGDAQPAALAAALIARQLVSIARFENAEAVAHGAASGSAAARRLAAAVGDLAADLAVITPVGEAAAAGRGIVERARALGIPVPSNHGQAPRADVNLWGRESARGLVDGTGQELPESAYVLTRSDLEAPADPAWVDVDFEAGAPVRINGVGMSLVELIQSLETIAGGHGVGRLDLVARSEAGAVERRVIEVPAAEVLHTAHAALLACTTPPASRRELSSLGETYAEIIGTGRWFTPTREAIDAFVERLQPAVSGTVRLRFFKGSCRVVGRQAKG